jgi:hypothetical protein
MLDETALHGCEDGSIQNFLTCTRLSHACSQVIRHMARMQQTYWPLHSPASADPSPSPIRDASSADVAPAPGSIQSARDNAVREEL